MAKKVNRTPSRTIYVEISDGVPVGIYDNPSAAEQNRVPGNRLARYEFVEFVRVDLKATVIGEGKLTRTDEG